MFIQLFKSNQRIVNVLIVLLTIMLWIPSFYSDSQVVVGKYSLFLFLEGLLALKWVNFAVSILLVCTQAIYLNAIVNRFKLIKDNTHLIALIYVILNGASLSFLIISPVLLTNWLVLLVLHQLLSAYNLKQAYSLSFNASLLIGFAGLIYFPAIVLLPVLWFALGYLKTANWREFVISFLGFIVPAVYGLVFYFISNQLPDFKLSYLVQNYFVSNFKDWYLSNYSYFWIVSLITLFALLFFTVSMNRSIVKIRKSMVLVFLMLIACAATVFLNKSDYLSSYIILTVPLAIILANFFNELKRKWLSELVFLSIICAIIVGYFS